MTSHDGVTGSDGRLINTLDTEERPEVVGGGSSCSVFEMGARVDGWWEEGGEEADDAEEEEEATCEVAQTQFESVRVRNILT